MHNRPLSPFSFPPEALDEAFRRAQAELRAAVGGDEPEVPAEAMSDDGFELEDELSQEQLLEGDELLRVVRQPVEWLLALAERLAADDDTHVAAVDRLRATFHSRLAGRRAGVRRSDALIAFGLLVGALDPTVVRRAATKSIADGVATILAIEGAAIAGQLAKLASALPTAVHRAPSPTRRCRARSTSF